MDTDDFPTEWQYRQHVKACKELCQVCPIVDECLSDALAMDVLGVWGGTTRKERHSLRSSLGMPRLRAAYVPESRDELVSAT